MTGSDQDRSASRKTPPGARGPRTPAIEHEPRRRRGAGLVLAGALTGLLGWAVAGLPRGRAPLPAIARQALTDALPVWHTTEPVNEIIYGSRVFDTFGETFLLLAAVIGVGTIARVRERRRGFIGEAAAGARERRRLHRAAARLDPDERQALLAERGEEGHGRWPATPDHDLLGTPGPEPAQAMAVPVRGAVRAVAPVLIVCGIYLAAWGFSPGGGFPAGVVLLGVSLLAYVSLGYRRVEPVLRPGVVEPVELLGALAIVLVALLGLFLAGSFTANFLPVGTVRTILSGGVIQAYSAGELIEVAAGLILAIFGLLGMEHDWSGS